MKHKSLRSLFLTALVAVSACVMQAHAEDANNSDFNGMTCHVTWGDDGGVINTFFTGIEMASDITTPRISLHLANSSVNEIGTRSTGILHIWGVGPASFYSSPDFWLSNADQIDAGVLQLQTTPSPNAIVLLMQPVFKAVAPGQTTLTFEGDVVVEKGAWSYLHWSYLPDKIKHVTVHVPVEVVE